MEEYIKTHGYFDRSAADDEIVSRLARNVQDLACFEIQQGDIFLATYPKCGTNWMKCILWGILNKGETLPGLNEMEYGNFFPLAEFRGTKVAETMASKTTFRTHLPVDFVPYSAQAKYIHVTRNPFDCCLSYYNYVMNFELDTSNHLPFDKFYDRFIEGKVNAGDYFQHVLGWYSKRKDDANYLHITYEEMSKDHTGSILKVARFLGEDYYKEISKDEALLKKIQHHSSLAYVKSLPKIRAFKDKASYGQIDPLKNNALADDNAFQTVEFFGKGQVGLFKSKFSEEQKQKMRKKMEEKFANTDLLYLWDEYL